MLFKKYKKVFYYFVFVIILLGTINFYIHYWRVKKNYHQPFSILELPKIMNPVYSTSIFIIEQKTKTIFFEKNADLIFPPASLTKMISLYLAYEAIHKGLVKETDIVPVSLRAWAKLLPNDATRMFLEPSQRPTLLDIMKGLAIPSGNDAAIALAEFLAKSEADFVQKMNNKVQEMGFFHMHFQDPNGLSHSNYITAREYTLFCRDYLERFPESIEELHKSPELIYPQKNNWPKSYFGRRRAIYQPNHNPFLGLIEGVDGLKTGFIAKSGYNIAFTAKRENMRMTGVILGSFAGTGKKANFLRIEDGKNLINYFYENYRLEDHLFQEIFTTPYFPELIAKVSPEYQEGIIVLKGSLKYRPVFSDYNPYHVAKNQVVGFLQMEDSMGRLAKVPLVSLTDHRPQNYLQQLLAFFFSLLTFLF